MSDETGSYEVWVRPFPQGPGRWQISKNGGGQPLWSRDGEGLFFVEQGVLVAVPVRTGQEFSWGQAEPLFSHESFGVMTNPRQTYGVSADSERSLVLEQPTDSTQTALRIVENWRQEFRDREQN